MINVILWCAVNWAGIQNCYDTEYKCLDEHPVEHLCVRCSETNKGYTFCPSLEYGQQGTFDEEL